LIINSRRPREVGHFLPDVAEGSQRVQSNDVTTDDRGLFYLLDRLRGLTILERCYVEPALVLTAPATT
jgi:hypothetical protein